MTAEQNDTMEYLGGLKFAPAAGKRVSPKMTLVDWLERAKDEFMLKQMATVINNFSDEEMEAWVRREFKPDEVMEMLADVAESAQNWVEAYRAGIDVLEATLARCIIIGERIEAQQKPN